MKAKIIQTFLIIFAILFVFSRVAYASATNPLSTDVADGDRIGNQIEEWGEEGTGQTVPNSGEEQSYDLTPSQSILDALITVISWVVALVPMIVNIILSVVVGEDTFSIQELLLGKYNIFHINIFDVDNLTGTNAEFVKELSHQTAIWYVSIRNLSAIICGIVLIYVGIRMAISSVADDKAKYKSMLKNWVISLALLFLLHYIMLLMLEASDLLVGFIRNSISDDSDAIGMEEAIINNSFVNIASATSFNKVIYVLMYFLMVYYQCKFFIMYFMRTLTVIFLIMIAPLICVTYPIDTMGDNEAQAFKNWTKQMLTQVFLQAIHLAIYVVFIYSAGEIAVRAPIVAIMFFAALSNGEKIVRKAFKVQGKGLKDIRFKKM